MTIDPDELARLEEERRFLLRSITDLEREFEAGDVDQADYETLKDGYTARAAAVLRSIDQGRSALPPKRRARPLAVAGWVVGVLVIAVVAGWLVARSSGQRVAGQTITGGQPADEVAVALTEARSLLGTGDYGGAFDRFRKVTELDPSNAEARTYTAWILVLNSRSLDDEATATASLDAALQTFDRVVTDEPTYADAHCLYAVTAANFLPEPDLDLARVQARACLDSNPPADMRGLVEGFLGRLEDTSASTTSP
jgi:tetratricopeptide (TPR) repeat protein